MTPSTRCAILALIAGAALAPAALAQLPSPGTYVMVPDSTSLLQRIILLNQADGSGSNNAFITNAVATSDGGLGFALPLEVLQPLSPAGSVPGQGYGNRLGAVSDQILVSDQNRGTIYRFNLAGDTLLGRIGQNLSSPLPLNIRGIDVVVDPVLGPVLYVACGAVTTIPTPPPTPYDNSIVRINLNTGAVIDSFAGPAGTLLSPWDVKAIADSSAPGGVAILVSDSQTDDITRWSTSGTLLSTLVASPGGNGQLNFPYQIALRPVGSSFNVLAAGFSGGAGGIGVYEYSSAGSFLNRYLVGTGPRGIHVLGNGEGLFTFGAGYGSVNFGTTAITSLATSGSTRLVNPLIIASPCYANCDGSSQPPVLGPADFSCFLAKFRAGDAYANCDGSTLPPVLGPADFSCFLAKFRAGCN